MLAISFLLRSNGIVPSKVFLYINTIDCFRLILNRFSFDSRILYAFTNKIRKTEYPPSRYVLFSIFFFCGLSRLFHLHHRLYVHCLHRKRAHSLFHLKIYTFYVCLFLAFLCRIQYIYQDNFRPKFSIRFHVFHLSPLLHSKCRMVD